MKSTFFTTPRVDGCDLIPFRIKDLNIVWVGRKDQIVSVMINSNIRVCVKFFDGMSELGLSKF